MATAEITDEIKDLQSNVALTLLNDLKAQNKISHEMYLLPKNLESNYYHRANIFKEKFGRLHDAVVQSFQNHKALHQKTQQLRSVFQILI